MGPQEKKIAVDVFLVVVSQVALYYGFKWIMQQMDPMKKKKEEAKTKAQYAKSKMNLSNLVLNEYEEVIMTEVVHSDDIQTTFEDVGGLEPIISSLKESVILPLCVPQVFGHRSSLLSAPKGVLLYGPPGCGKTMLAKALAKESGASFINLHLSTLTEKWFGESQKLVHGVFTLARKLQPTIIFIDEIDSFLRTRQASDHETTSMMKAEFMTLWDGLNTHEGDSRILILGATNRIEDIDSAILRRMPKRFSVNLPNQVQRTKILKLILQEVELERNFDFNRLISLTNGYSGSELKELCRNAAMYPVRECMREKLSGNRHINELTQEELKVRPLKLSDFMRNEEDDIFNEDAD